MRLFFLLFLCMQAGASLAEERVMICREYGCLVQDEVRFSESDLQHVQQMLLLALDANAEREVLAQLVGYMYTLAGRQSLIANDKAGNFADAGQPGKMDCIDHSTTTTRFLQLIQYRAGMRWHRVLPVQLRRRGFVFEHWSAAIEEIDGGARYVIDSWFVNNGQPAVVLPLDEWKEGAGPSV